MTPPDTKTQESFWKKGRMWPPVETSFFVHNSLVESKYAETTDWEMASNTLSDLNNTKSQKSSGEGGTLDFKGQE